jgi:hypothetical protein
LRFHLVPTVLILALVLLGAGVPDAVAAGGVYQWTDGNGAVHFTDDPGKIPKKFHDTVLELRPPDKEKPKGIPSEENPESASTPEAASKPESVSKPATEPERPQAAPYEAVDFNGHNRDWWQRRVQEWQNKKADAQEKLADAQERLGQERFLNATTGNMQRIQDISAEVSMYEAQILEAENMLTDGLPDEARRAQAPPGWLRD